MKRITRLTERDLTKLVKRVINEGIIQPVSPTEFMTNKPNGRGTFEVKNNSLILKDQNGGTFEIICN